MLKSARLGLAAFCACPLALPAQDPKLTPPAGQPSLLRAGDSAPPLSVESFLAGEPIAEFARGQIYVVEFWATWCGPCIGAMPHLSDLQTKYRDDGVTVLGVDVWEDRGPAPRSEADVRSFVERRRELMAYRVAYDGKSGQMAKTWLDAAGQRSIPATFVVDKTGKLAWIGHPDYVALAVQRVVRGTWDPTQGAAAIEAAGQRCAQPAKSTLPASMRATALGKRRQPLTPRLHRASSADVIPRCWVPVMTKPLTR